MTFCWMMNGYTMVGPSNPSIVVGYGPLEKATDAPMMAAAETARRFYLLSSVKSGVDF